MLSQRWHLWELQRGGNLREEGMDCVVGGKKSPSDFFLLLRVFSNLCGSVSSSWMRISAILVRSNFSEILLQGFKSLRANTWVNDFSMWRIIYQNHSLRFSKTVAMILPAEGVALNFFFRGEFGRCHSTTGCLRLRL